MERYGETLMYTESIRLKDVFPFLGEEGRDPVLDIYLPYNLKELHRENMKRPCMVICPGGAYLFCSELEQEPVALKFLSRGYNVFVLKYSVTPHTYPSQLNEVAAVFELIYKNADKWNCDTGKTVLLGFSAGGHLAAHYSNAYAIPEVRKAFPDSKKPAASVLCYPVITTDERFSHKKSFRYLLGHEPDSEEKKRFSCELLVTSDTPPAFLWHTAKDENVPVQNSLLYAMALAEQGIDYELHIYPFGRHGMSTADLETNDKIDFKESANAGWVSSVNHWLNIIFNNF